MKTIDLTCKSGLFLTDILAISFSISEFYVYLKDKQVREVKARNRKIDVKRMIIGRRKEQNTQVSLQ